MNNTELPEGIEIHDNMEIPSAPPRRTYPFALLEVGQCFMLECDDTKHLNSLRSSVNGWNKKGEEEGTEYIIRRIPDTQRTVGVWRVS